MNNDGCLQFEKHNKIQTLILDDNDSSQIIAKQLEVRRTQLQILMKAKQSHNNVHCVMDHDVYNVSLEDNIHQSTMTKRKKMKRKKIES